MRLVEVLIPEGKKDSVLEALDSEEIDYAVWNETGRGDFEAVVQFPVPPVGVEPLLDKLRKAGVSEDTYTIVLSPEMVISKRIAALKKRFPDQRISREELIARAEDLAPPASTLYCISGAEYGYCNCRAPARFGCHDNWSHGYSSFNGTCNLYKCRDSCL
ncbi:hypothetical protein [Methanosarcina mazei]|jgi:hypothetical protein|uniref:Uncharacterized protein n=1 Tax=Methanosarcina mazei LYC TaxID=1434114 RepID=A0A0E3RPT8_METMZ|nr:hypothetical protein [Methanosarcina mazei]AKB67843.1 hypothetical protein MSMAL_1300 [Methanosarcina mazei LYC]